MTLGSRDDSTTDEVSISFIDVRAKTTVSREVDPVPRKLGSQYHDASPGPRHGRVAHWTLDALSTTWLGSGRFWLGPALSTGLSPPVGPLQVTETGAVRKAEERSRRTRCLLRTIRLMVDDHRPAIAVKRQGSSNNG